MNIYPAIDLLNGQAVRLTKGNFNTKEVFSSHPEEVLDYFISCNARHLHVVDLDGARFGTADNFDTIKTLTLNKDIFVEVGGGIRSEERIEKYLSLGVKRVILGTIAVENFDFVASAVKKYGDCIAVGVDALDNKVALHGWETVSDIDSMYFCKKCLDVGVKTVIYTDINTDGVMKGTNIEAYYNLSRINGLEIIASGGISSYDELYILKSMNISGAILGKALYKNILDLSKAIEIATAEEHHHD